MWIYRNIMQYTGWTHTKTWETMDMGQQGGKERGGGGEKESFVSLCMANH